MSTKDNTAGQNMQRLREARGWSQNELARRLVAAGLKTYTSTFVGRTERGDRTMKIDEGVTVAHVLGVDLSTLAGDSAGENAEARLQSNINRLTSEFESLVTQMVRVITARQGLGPYKEQKEAATALKNKSFGHATKEAIWRYAGEDTATAIELTEHTESAVLPALTGGTDIPTTTAHEG